MCVYIYINIFNTFYNNKNRNLLVPQITNSPFVGLSIVPKIFNKDVLTQTDEKKIVNHSPLFTSNEIPLLTF